MDQNTGINQTKQTKIREFGYQTEQTDRNTVFAQTKHTEAWVLSRPSKPIYGNKLDRTDRNTGTNQTEI